MSKLIQVIHYAAVTTGSTLLLLLFMEGSARFFSGSAEPPFTQLPIIEKQPWAKEYLEDRRHYNWETQYAPYVGFVAKPHQSKTINIDDNHHRRTDFNSSDEKALRVYFFGGSTALGTGVPDWGTIPSYLSKALNQQGGKYRPVKITNFGCLWWQSTQELTQLMVELRAGARPDVVLFYDGINDFNVVAHGGAAGRIAPRFQKFFDETYNHYLNIKHSFAKGLLRESYLLRVLLSREWFRTYFNRVVYRNKAKQIQRKDFSPEDVKTAAGMYLQNIQWAMGLGSEFGFKTYFYLQPYPLLATKELTPDEAKEMGSDREGPLLAGAQVFYDQVRNSERLKSLSQFVDLSRAFDGVTEEIFLDSEHVLPRGNEIVAQKILQATPALKVLNRN